MSNDESLLEDFDEELDAVEKAVYHASLCLASIKEHESFSDHRIETVEASFRNLQRSLLDLQYETKEQREETSEALHERYLLDQAKMCEEGK